MAVQPPPEAKLLDQWSDGISAIQYLSSAAISGGSSTTLLASTSWDGTVRLHDTATTTTKSAMLSHNMQSGPLLSMAAPNGSGSLVTGGLDGSIKSLDIETTTVQLIGKHGGSGDNDNKEITACACSCMSAMNGEHPQLIATASWNRQLCLWDLRQQQQQSNKAAAATTVNLPGKAFSMDVDSVHERIVVGCAGRSNVFYDLRMGTTMMTQEDYSLEKVLVRDSSLKFQTRCVKFFPSGNAFGIGSIEGRVGVEYLDELGMPSVGMKKYAFKCHRVGDIVYPVNVIAFHPKYTTTFATGGCDGTVVLWDAQQKKKLVALPKFPTSISALAFSEDGTELAIASSYTHEEGDREHPQDEVYIRKILESEAMPKAT